MRLLVVEDEPRISKFVCQGLREAGYAVDATFDGREANEFVLSADYDLIILDIMLPGIDGLSLLKLWRNRGVQTPVLLLTARDSLEDRVDGLDTGADDYLVKPFLFPELLARARALLRRPPLQSDNVLRVGDLELDNKTHQVRRSGRLIELSQREFMLLNYLMRNPNQVLTRTQIAEHIWNFDFASDSNIVDVYIGYLRRKIDHNHPLTLIRTVRGMGYRISAVTDTE